MPLASRIACTSARCGDLIGSEDRTPSASSSTPSSFCLTLIVAGRGGRPSSSRPLYAKGCACTIDAQHTATVNGTSRRAPAFQLVRVTVGSCLRDNLTVLASARGQGGNLRQAPGARERHLSVSPEQNRATHGLPFRIDSPMNTVASARTLPKAGLTGEQVRPYVHLLLSTPQCA
jgi:hypothetical protein